MIDGQKKVIQFCEEIAENAKAADIAEVKEKASQIADIARQQELIVPVVGGFSSGKSTLINTIIDRDILPVGISPETSLATELRYSPEEFIEAVKKDGCFDRYGAEEITTVKDRAADYKYSKLFLKNDVIKEIEPLVLVDMPGFDSPLDQHNKAINEYLDRGCHYIVLSSAEEGTVSKSLLRRLKLIDECGRSFSFFLSKANLRTETVINELVAHYQQSIKDNLDLNIPIEATGNASGQDVVRKLLSIDVNKLFFGLFRVQLAELCHELINLLNTRINASKATLESSTGLIREMERSVGNIQRKADELVADIQSRYSGSTITNIVNNDIGRALDNSLEELVNSAMTGNSHGTASLLNEIINDALMVSAKNKLQEINDQITSDFSSEVLELDSLMKDCGVDGNFTQRLAGSIHAQFDNLQNIMGKLGDPAFAGKWAAITGILAAVTNIIFPVLEAVIIVLPLILQPLMEGRQREKIRKGFLSNTFPEIKRKLKTELSKQFDDQIKLMIEQVRDQYGEKIRGQQIEIENAVKLRQADAEVIQKQIAGLEAARQETQKIANAIREEN
jgi:hypothetical protein